jgi:hypothetical protein
MQAPIQPLLLERCNARAWASLLTALAPGSSRMRTLNPQPFFARPAIEQEFKCWCKYSLGYTEETGTAKPRCSACLDGYFVSEGAGQNIKCAKCVDACATW